MLQRLKGLRALLKEHGLQAYVIPSEDPHMSEYVASAYHRRAFISGFTGSAGTAVVPTDESQRALLWTDGRYFEQATRQLDSAHWTMMKDRVVGSIPVIDWLCKSLPKASRVGIDPQLLNMQQGASWSARLAAAGHELVYVNENLVDLVWGAERPAEPSMPTFVHPDSLAGKSVAAKLADLRRATLRADPGAPQSTDLSGPADHVALSALDEIAWLFNLRGADVHCCPVALAYALVSRHSATLFLRGGAHAHSDIAAALAPNSVSVAPYADFFPALAGCAAAPDTLIALDEGSATAAMAARIPAAQRVVVPNALQLPKAIKNEVELRGMRASHERDGAALCRFFCWLEREVVERGNAELTECSISARLEQFRAEQPDFVSLSFDTIAGVGANGSVIHYKPEESTCVKVAREKMLLVDSGGQYRDGTTDVTRTVHYGKPSSHERRCFARVLQGFIQLGLTSFPPGTTGYALDAIARVPLWREGLNYLHGTGHGVGAFLNVHEGPHGISFRIGSANQALVAGMTVTNEPGYYEAGNFGIRIENVMIVVDKATPHRFPNGDTQYLGFEHITMAPIQTSLIDVDLLSDEERLWLNNYHAEVLARLTPHLADDQTTLAWLRTQCKPI